MAALRRILPGLLLVSALSITALWWHAHSKGRVAVTHSEVGQAQTVRTRHYAITSSATATQTQQVASAIERLHDAYVGFFGDLIGPDRDRIGLQLVLYKDRLQFQSSNSSYRWAEAFYRPPACHAYFEAGAANPYHWMLHEATHQLNDLVAHFRLRTWASEGVATYFGTSSMEDGRLMPGKIDPHTYPIWWISRLQLSGDLRADIAAHRFIPLRTILASTAEDIGSNVNLYYIEYWSLTHFLLEHDHARYASRYRHLLATDTSPASFEATFGPVDAIESEWYRDLQGQVMAIGHDSPVTAIGQ